MAVTYGGRPVWGHMMGAVTCAGGVAGLMHTEIGGYRPCDIEVVAAFDIDARKVGTQP